MPTKRSRRPAAQGPVDPWAAIARHAIGWGQPDPAPNAVQLILAAHPGISLEPLLPRTRRGRVDDTR